MNSPQLSPGDVLVSTAPSVQANVPGGSLNFTITPAVSSLEEEMQILQQTLNTPMQFKMMNDSTLDQQTVDDDIYYFDEVKEGLATQLSQPLSSSFSAPPREQDMGEPSPLPEKIDTIIWSILRMRMKIVPLIESRLVEMVSLLSSDQLEALAAHEGGELLQGLLFRQQVTPFSAGSLMRNEVNSKTPFTLDPRCFLHSNSPAQLTNILLRAAFAIRDQGARRALEREKNIQSQKIGRWLGPKLAGIMEELEGINPRCASTVPSKHPRHPHMLSHETERLARNVFSAGSTELQQPAANLRHLGKFFLTASLAHLNSDKMHDGRLRAAVANVLQAVGASAAMYRAQAAPCDNPCTYASPTHLTESEDPSPAPAAQEAFMVHPNAAHNQRIAQAISLLNHGLAGSSSSSALEMQSAIHNLMSDL